MVQRAIHWQLVWVSQVALAHGVFYTAAWFSGVRLSAGVGALPRPLRLALAVCWVAAAVFGHVSALWIRARHSLARFAMGVMFGTWCGAYFYGWVWGDATSGWLLAWVYAALGLAVVTPPVWLVTIKSKSGL